MDQRISTILPRKKAMLARDNDINLSLEIKASEKEILENKIQHILNLNEQFQLERNSSTKYRINGVIEVESMFIGVPSNILTESSPSYKILFDNLTTDQLGNTSFTNLTDFFDLYLLVPHKYQQLSDNTYNLYLKSVTQLKDLNLFECGFSNNIYGNKKYQFSFNNVIDIDSNVPIPCYDKNGDIRFYQPISKFYLYLDFKNKPGLSITNKYTNNDLVNGNVIEGNYSFDIDNYIFNRNSQLKYNVIMNTLENCDLSFDFYPTNEITVRVFGNGIEEGNILSTDNIPYYGYILDDETNDNDVYKSEGYYINNINYFSGTTRLTLDDPMNALPRKLIYNTNTNYLEFYLENSVYDSSLFNFYLTRVGVINNPTKLINGVDYIISEIEKNKIFIRFVPQFGDTFNFTYMTGQNYVWRDLLEVGFFEDAETGIDYPFLNGNHYLFSDIKNLITPNFNDTCTTDLFCKYQFSIPTISFTPPSSILNDKCN